MRRRRFVQSVVASTAAVALLSAGLLASTVPSALAGDEPLPDEVDDPLDEPDGGSVEGDDTGADPAILAAEEAAMAAAVASGVPTVVEELTSERSLVTADPVSRTFTAELSPSPERVRDEAGEWVDVDTTLVLGDDGIVRPVATSADLEFSGGGTGALARIADGNEWLEFGWALGELPAPELDGSIAVYSDVLPDVDLVVEAGVEDFSQYLVVHTPEAAAHPELAGIEFPVVTSNGLELTGDHDIASGGVVAADEAGDPVFWVPEPRMWDSTGKNEVFGLQSLGPDQGARPPAAEVIEQGPQARTAVMGMHVAGAALQVSPDDDLLSDPETVFPLIIDPTVSRYHTHCKMVWSNGMEPSCSTSSGGQARVGYDGWSGENKRARVYYRFSNSTFRGTQILDKRFTHRQVHSPPHTCGGTFGPAVELSWSGSASSSTTWSNQPSGASSTYSTTARSHGHRNHCSGYTTTEWNAKAAVERAVSRDDSTLTIRLRSTNESNRDGWRQFNHVTDASPRLQVTYNRPPNKPTSLRTTSPSSTGCPASADRPWFNDNTPVLRATITDPDGDQVRGRFSYSKRGSDGTWGSWTYHNTAYASSGTERSWQLPTLSDGRYRWRVRGYDGNTYGPYSSGPDSSYCYFEIKTNAPGAPSISISSPYALDVWKALDSRPQATLTIGRGSDSTVDRFMYSIGSSTPTTTRTMSGSTGTVTFTPSFGVTVISARLVDKAGNQGPPRSVVLKLSSPTAQHGWMLNDGTPGVAADAARPAGRAMDLTFGPDVTWDTGFLADESDDPDDLALRFPGSGSGATTTGPGVFPPESFTVTARVKVDELEHTGQAFIALSQDGPANSAFKLGRHNSSGRWAAWMHTTGESSGSWRTLDSGVEPVGEHDADGMPCQVTQLPCTPDWTHLALVYDAPTKVLRLYVDGSEEAHMAVTDILDWAHHGGVLRVGRGQTNGSIVGTASGKVDDVVIFHTALDTQQIERLVGINYADELEFMRDEL